MPVMEGYAPIAFFAYKRPGHAKRALEALIENEEFTKSPVYIFCDGPKTPKDTKMVGATRAAIRSFARGNATVVERDRNMGLANSIITGVTELCGRYGRVIVVEDDLVVAPSFLDYMNRALDMYRDEERVMQVSGHMFPVELSAKTDAVFLPFTTTWGWATWGRAWRLFEPGMNGYERLKRDRALRRKFDLGGAYPYFRMLEMQMKGDVDSWGIKWYLSVFMAGGLTLYPARSLVENTGFDGSGTHCRPRALCKHFYSNYRVKNFPAVEQDEENFIAVRNNIKHQNSLVFKIMTRIRAR